MKKEEVEPKETELEEKKTKKNKKRIFLLPLAAAAVAGAALYFLKPDTTAVIPNVCGMAYAEAESKLQEEGFSAKLQREYSDAVQKDVVISQDIGRIFRKYNIIEYKSPSDYLGVNDFYQTYGYACFYKADTAEEDSILITEVTLTFVCSHYPRVVLRHLEKVRGYTIHQEEEGIYYIEGDIMPIQIIVTARLSSGRNLWLRSLTNRLDHMKDARQLVSEYKAYKNNTLYQSVMNLIVRANKEKFEEVKEMCDALMELMKDEFEELKKESIAEGRVEGQELNLISLIQRKVKKSKPLEVIARELEAGIDSIRDIYEMVKSNPLAGEEDIYKRLHSAK